MSEIRPLTPEELGAFVDIVANAYPGWKIVTKEEKQRTRENLLKAHQEDPTAVFYGLFRDGRLLGGMRLHDFELNFLQTPIAAGGVGLVAVDLVHKKEQVAKEMIAYFLRHYRQRGAPITMLYSFRPDFYKKMGFGCGTKVDRYCVRPDALPQGKSKARVRYLGPDDQAALLHGYQRFQRRTHGMIARSERDLKRLVENQKARIVGCEQDGQILGYLVFTFETSDVFLTNDLHVNELVYETPQALSELLTFLRAQADQIRHVILETQDAFFHHLLLDPRVSPPTFMPPLYHQSNQQGIGIMYRLVDTLHIFELLKERDFGAQTCRLRLTVEDSFLPENAGSALLCFEAGRLRLDDESDYDVQVRLDVAELSSLLAGVVGFRCLHRYGLVHISDPAWVGVVDKIFAVEDSPVCMTLF